MSVEQASKLFSTTAAEYANAVSEALLQEDTQVVAYAATVTPTVSRHRNVMQIAALTGNIAIGAPIGARKGMSLTFLFTQDATGSRTVTWNAVFKAAANGAGAANTVGSTTFYFDGTNWVQDAGALVFK